MYNRTVQYSSTVQKERADTNERTNERTTNEIPFNRKDFPKDFET